jgi:hypothetical protein
MSQIPVLALGSLALESYFSSRQKYLNTSYLTYLLSNEKHAYELTITCIRYLLSICHWKQNLNSLSPIGLVYNGTKRTFRLAPTEPLSEQELLYKIQTESGIRSDSRNMRPSNEQRATDEAIINTAKEKTKTVSAIQLIRDYISRQTEEDSPLWRQLWIRILNEETYGKTTELTLLVKNKILFTIRESSNTTDSKLRLTIPAVHRYADTPSDENSLPSQSISPVRHLEIRPGRRGFATSFLFNRERGIYYVPSRTDLGRHLPQSWQYYKHWEDRYTDWNDEVRYGEKKVSELAPEDMVFWELEGLLIAVGMCLESESIRTIDLYIENDDFTCFSSGYQYPWQEHMEDGFGYGYDWDDDNDINRPAKRTIRITKPGICGALTEGIRHLEWLRVNRMPKKYMGGEEDGQLLDGYYDRVCDDDIF